MREEIAGPEVERYLVELSAEQHRSDVLDEMEARAERDGFPIVGPAVGRFLEAAARAVGARRVMELGSGFGYSAYWFARAVGSDGEVICTDGSADNARDAEGYLSRAGAWGRVAYRVGDALAGMASTDGDFDVVYCDVDKDGYPECFRAAADRLLVGGAYLCDNTLWRGMAATGEPDNRHPGWVEAIREHNRLVAADPRFVSQIVPIRDGVMFAVKTAA
ncbi:MAG: O-methyltransferase [Actinobacteria bacterium]|nr:O-methyltransferase [Actinomycetota bacterium]